MARIEPGYQKNRWTVLYLDEKRSAKTKRKYWFCECACGKTKSVRQDGITSGQSPSCGCQKNIGAFKKKDLAGLRFGKLEVVEKTPVKRGNSYLYRCICDCGTHKDYTSSELRKYRSCGCAQYVKDHLRTDLSGEKLNMLTAILPTGHTTDNRVHIWKFLCDCGETTTASVTQFKLGLKKSCGCLRNSEALSKRFTTHGMTGTPEYFVWNSIIQRCFGSDERTNSYYKDRGITVCDRWLEFENFYEDMGPRPSSDYSIDRVDGTKGYYKENCVWATRQIQIRNQRKREGTRYEYKGVFFREDRGYWTATLDVCGERLQISKLESEEIAAAAYNALVNLIFDGDEYYKYQNNVDTIFEEKDIPLRILSKIPEIKQKVAETHKYV